MEVLQLVLLAILPALVIVAGLKDLTSMKIPNWISGLLILGFFPAALLLGLTVPEMAALMGALGARDAMLLDGGISGQLLVRDGRRTHAWTGLRKVPLGIVVESP